MTTRPAQPVPPSATASDDVSGAKARDRGHGELLEFDDVTVPVLFWRLSVAAGQPDRRLRRLFNDALAEQHGD
jgi:hypothetical protein